MLGHKEFVNASTTLYELLGHKVNHLENISDNVSILQIHARHGEEWVVRCDSQRQLTYEDVRLFVSSIDHSQVDKLAIIHNGSVTSELKATLKGLAVEVIDKHALQKYLSFARSNASVPAEHEIPQTKTSFQTSNELGETSSFDTSGKRKCPYCAENILVDAIVCRYCHSDLINPSVTLKAQQQKDLTWNPGIAAILSLFIPGSGQIYKGELSRGLLWLILVPIGYVLLVVPGVIMHIMCIAEAYTKDPQIRSNESPNKLNKSYSLTQSNSNTQIKAGSSKPKNARLAIIISIFAALCCVALFGIYLLLTSNDLSTASGEPGIGISLNEVRSVMGSFGYDIERSSDVDGQPRYLGISGTGTATIEVMGSASDLAYANIMIGLPDNSFEIFMNNLSEMVIFINLVVPDWPSGDEWLQSNIEGAVSGQSFTTTYSNKIITLEGIGEGMFVSLTVRAKP